MKLILVADLSGKQVSIHFHSLLGFYRDVKNIQDDQYRFGVCTTPRSDLAN